ncbi:MAG TPA: preprotein translocase subunit SecE [Syntrophobacteraceae bacterium]|nr:preprotein translocase subunit SecE [Syntrophobacteraceae bacterium]
MKLIARKEQGSDKKPQGMDAVKKSPDKAAAARPARLKKSEAAKKTDAVRKTDVARKPEVQKKVVKRPGEVSMAWVETVRTYLREVSVELKKVIWPSRKETMGSTAVVLVIVGLTAVFLGIVDLILSRLVKLLVG